MIVMMKSLFFLISCLGSMDEVVGPLASTWSYCECIWLPWAPWSSCTKQCYGRKYRDRKVRLTQHPGCVAFTDCASNDMGSEWADCNEFCYNGGSYVSSIIGCSCISGKLGRCCDKTVTCAAPIKPSNGDLSSTGTVYGSTTSYTCNTGYNLTEGSTSRTCEANGGWSGITPTCRYVNTCSSNPCLNNALCIDGIEEYTCQCQPGWSGKHCENDIQPPVMTNCSQGKLVYTADTKAKVDWAAPQFTDPMGREIQVTKNYVNPSIEAPWGDFVVQYVANKHSNGLQTECNFTVQVRPHPCAELNIPINGARVCNGWKTDYARVCLVFCSDGSSLDIGSDPRQWYVCGATGNWLPSSSLPNCSMPTVNIGNVPDIKDYQYSNCSDHSIKETYISKLKSSLEKAPCDKNPDECAAENVIVDC